MHVHVERRSDVVVIGPVGRFFGGDETKELEYKLGALLIEGRSCVVVDLERTRHLNSSAIGVLVGAHIRAQRRGSEIRICNADRNIHNTLVVLKLVNELHVYDTLRQATASLPPGLPPEGRVKSGPTGGGTRTSAR
ncbi:MAG: STAS domain-containing protein [Candidatus Krumholzibacteriia bacterium]